MEGKCTWFPFLLCKTAFHKNPLRASVRGWAIRCVWEGVQCQKDGGPAEAGARSARW